MEKEGEIGESVGLPYLTRGERDKKWLWKREKPAGSGDETRERQVRRRSVRTGDASEERREELKKKRKKNRVYFFFFFLIYKIKTTSNEKMFLKKYILFRWVSMSIGQSDIFNYYFSSRLIKVQGSNPALDMQQR